MKLFNTGQGSRERQTIKVCPICDSINILYNLKSVIDRALCKCGNCGWKGSRKSLLERDINRYEKSNRI